MPMFQDIDRGGDVWWDLFAHVLPRFKSKVMCPCDPVTIGFVGFVHLDMQFTADELIHVSLATLVESLVVFACQALSLTQLHASEVGCAA